MLGFVVPFTNLSKLWKDVGPKVFCWAKLACFDLSSSNFNFQGHILNTGGVALRSLTFYASWCFLMHSLGLQVYPHSWLLVHWLLFSGSFFWINSGLSLSRFFRRELWIWCQLLKVAFLADQAISSKAQLTLVCLLCACWLQFSGDGMLLRIFLWRIFYLIKRRIR